MTYKKPRYWIIAIAAVLCIAVSIAFFTVGVSAKQSDYVTYEFETYSGKTIKIDATNIISQKAEENVAETDKIPADAEIIAPGRDYTYWEDENYYYVADAENNLLTIAEKNEVARYAGKDFGFDYNAGCFYLYEDENGGITLSYNKEGAALAGSNVMTFVKVGNQDSLNLMKEKVSAFGGNTAEIKEVKLGGGIQKAYVYSFGGASPESSLKTEQTYYTVQSENGAVLVDEFRTIGPDEKTETDIETAFAYVLENLTVK